MTHPRCDDCPVSPAILCLMETSAHKKFCALQAADPAYRRYVIEHSPGQPHPETRIVPRAEKPRVLLGTPQHG